MKTVRALVGEPITRALDTQRLKDTSFSHTGNGREKREREREKKKRLLEGHVVLLYH